MNNLADNCWKEIRKTQFAKIAVEAEKNNIKLMLEGKEVKEYPYGVKREYGSYHTFTECFSGLVTIPASVPAQERYHEMLNNEDYVYFETYEEASGALDELEIASQTFKHV